MTTLKYKNVDIVHVTDAYKGKSVEFQGKRWFSRKHKFRSNYVVVAFLSGKRIG